MHPFFNVSGLSDDELREKLTSLQTRFFAAQMMGMSPAMKMQLGILIETIEMEQQNRYAAEMQKAWDGQFPDIIETDPDMKPDAQAKKADTEKKDGRKERPAHVPSFNKVYKK